MWDDLISTVVFCWASYIRNNLPYFKLFFNQENKYGINDITIRTF